MNKRFSFRSRLSGCFMFLGFVLLAASPSPAIFIGPVDLGTAGPDHYTLLTIETGTKLTANNESSITGNVGILGGAGQYSTSGDAFIDGTAFLAGAQVIDPTRAANVITNADTLLQQARTDALSAAGFAAGLSPTIVSGPPLSGNPATINGGFGHITISGGAGTNVVNLYDLYLTNDDVLTLDAPAGAAFVINISNEFKINGSSNGGRIELSGGLTPLNVLYNLVGSGKDVVLTGGSTGNVPNAQIYGTVLAPQRSVQFTPGVVYGEIISGGSELTLTSGADAIGFEVVPEVSAFAPLLGILSLASFVQASGRKRKMTAWQE
jgi:choice-of-anchor A domain-containing protein